MKKNISIISDDLYFINGASSVLHEFSVIGIHIGSEVNLYQEKSGFFENIFVDINSVLIISIKCISLMLKIVNHFSNTMIPILVFFNEKNENRFFTKIKNITILSKHIDEESFKQVLYIASSSFKIKELQLSHRQVYIMRWLMKGGSLESASATAGISLKTASAHKISFLKEIDVRCIQQAFNVIMFILSFLCEL